jgi:site-specific recombinase XerD
MGSKGSKGTLRAKPRARQRQRADARLDLVIEEFLYECQQTLAPDTCRAYRGPLALFLGDLRETLGHEPLLSDLTLDTVRNWTARLKQRHRMLCGGQVEDEAPLAIESVRTYLRTLRVFANWLAQPPQRYCPESPLRYLKLPKGDRPPRKPVSTDALQRMLAVTDRETVDGVRTQALLLTLVDSGLRAKELASLTIGDVSLQDGVLLVRRAKSHQPRLVVVGKETELALRRYIVLRDSRPSAETAATAPFFQTIHRTAFTYYGLRSWLRRLERLAGVPHVHLHLLRHTSAIETLESGADVRTVQLKLGHADIGTTQGYLNMAPQRISQRQRSFSPVDRLGLTASKRTRSTRQDPLRPLWRQSSRER